jgi:hypothetical protein
MTGKLNRLNEIIQIIFRKNTIEILENFSVKSFFRNHKEKSEKEFLENSARNLQTNFFQIL